MLALFHFATEPNTPDGFVSAVVELHARLVKSHPELATFCRSPVVLTRIRDAGVAQAAAHARDRAEHAEETVRKYQGAIAAQLVEQDEFMPHAGILARDVPKLEERLEIERARRTEHARSELERVERDQLELERLKKIEASEKVAAASAAEKEAAIEQQRRMRAALLARGKSLAPRVRKNGVLRYNRGVYDAAELAGLLERGEIAQGQMDQIEAALREPAQ